MNASVRIHKLGDDIDTDVIIAGRHLANSDPEYLARHCLEAICTNFHERVSPGDVIVAGRNFGCGSSRESAALAIKATGIDCVVGRSFSRIFFRNAVNIGLSAIICPEAVDAVEDGDLARVNAASGLIEIGGKSFYARPLPDSVMRIVSAGGLVALMKERHQSR